MAFENYGGQNIYQNQDQKGATSLVGSAMEGYGNAQKLSQVGLQNKQLEMQNAQAKQADYLKKAEAFGGEMHAVASLPPDQQPAAYARSRQQLIQAGIATPDQAPEQYDPNFLRQMSAKYQQMAPAFDEHRLKQAQTGHLNAQTSMVQSQTPKSLSGEINPDMDPASLVARQVPKELHAKAFEEIKNAQDINGIKPKIMDAFQRGGSADPVVAAQGQRELQALLMTTVKDTEGTVRQAAMDAVKNTMTPSGITATRGENDAKARTIHEYLASKSSAPIAKGYGIDLTKFNSTKHDQYQEPDSPSPGVTDRLASVFNSANASAPKAAPKGTILMQGPDGSMNYVPISQKGEAIASGGKVIK